MPTITIYAGVNGAGKTSLYNKTKNKTKRRINLDEIICEIKANNNSNDSIVKAGKIALNLIKDYLKSKLSFNWETTLITPTHLKIMQEAKRLGYKINLIFISVNDLNIAQERINQRVLAGGHNVPQNLVEYRFNHQFDKIKDCLNLVDTAIFFDNSNNLKIVAIYKNKHFEKIDNNIYWINNFLSFLNKEN